MGNSVKAISAEVAAALGSTLGWRSPSEAGRYAGVIAEIRRWDFSSHSDRELRRALDRIRGEVPQSRAEGRLPEVFAVVDETVSRRLGAWRLFEPDFDCGDMGVYRDVADRILDDAVYRDRRGDYRAGDFLESNAFGRMVERLLADMGLDSKERTIVRTLVYVSEKRASVYQPEIVLDAEFYRAVDAKDTDHTLRFRATDQQLLGGLLLYKGTVVDMKSGEGKTVAAVFPAVLHALCGRSVHVMTANDYLALRDAEWLAPVYESLGYTVYALLDHMIDDERRTAYQGDVVYGTVREFGFDFLRDNLKYAREERVQGRREVAIVDEADHALIDQARTPLIISGKGPSAPGGLRRIERAVRDLVGLQSAAVQDLEAGVLGAHDDEGMLRRRLATLLLAEPDSPVLSERLSRRPGLIRRLRSVIAEEDLEDSRRALTDGLYYELDQSLHAVSLTRRGQTYLEGRLGGSLFEAGGRQAHSDARRVDARSPVGAGRLEQERRARSEHRRHRAMNHVYQMLRAHVLMARDVDYAVVEEAVVPIDEATGRLRPDSRYQHGLHQALETKEGVPVHPEGEVLAEITVQGYLRQYGSLSGMTGTALAARDELRRTYGLDAAAVPPSNRSARADLGPRVYRSRREKLCAAVDEIKLCRRVGRPVLVAAKTVGQSEELSALLRTHGIDHRLLNAVTTFDESRVVREAGMLGSVTIATNMAGRGTDVVLQHGLDSLVIDGYCGLIREHLAEGRKVLLECHTPADAERLRAALGDAALPPGVRIAQSRGGLEVEAAPAPRSIHEAERVRLRFGLGLHVIGTEINESVRSDLQLRGRSGRQGSAGSSEFFLSVEDEMLRLNETGFGRESQGDVDASGRPYVGGDAAVRRLERVQGMVERDLEAQRGASGQFVRVLESHTLAYFRLRGRVMASDSIHDDCVGFARDRAVRLVEERLPWARVMEEYHSSFETLAEDVRLDYGIDCGPLRGASLATLSAGIGEMLVDRLDMARSVLGTDVYYRLEKLLYLQTADELWRSHISRAEEAMSAARLCGLGLKGALADYALQADGEFALFRQEVADALLRRLLDFPIEATMEDDGQDHAETKELAEILA